MASKKQGRPFHFSPSVYHRYLMDQMEQTLSYRGGDVATWQRRLRAKLRQLLGLPRGPRCELNVRRLWQRPHRLGTIEKVVFTAEPYADVPAFVCLPKGIEAPYTFFICAQGHSGGMYNSIAVERDDNTRPIEVAGDRDTALGCMKRGLAALCIEQRSFGERRELVQKAVSPHGCHDATMQALMLGRTLLGERVFDIDRGIDYLAWRGDADMRRIGVMGNSGGGTVTVFGAAVLRRLAYAMPSCFFCSFRDSMMSIYHCADNYVPGLLKYAEMADVMGLFAPRPVVAVAGRDDTIFPIAATRRQFRRLKAIYKAAGDASRCQLVIGPEGHRFYADLAWPKMLRQMERP